MRQFRGQPLITQGYTPQRAEDNSSMPRKTTPRIGTVLDRVFLAYKDRYKDEPTQSKVAQVLACDQTTVGEWGRGALPKGTLAVKIAKTLDVTLDWLFFGRGPQHPNEIVESQFAQAVELITREWPESERARTLQYLIEKGHVIKQSLPDSVAEIMERLQSETGKFRKPS
jgi:DNA-binding XRE family transcriptional regulator